MRWIFAILLFVAVAVALIIWLLKSKCKKMEHIVYIHINNDKILPNLGLSFDPQFAVQTEMQPLRDYEPHRTYFSLNITKTKDFVESLYGDHISSLTAIVGNNGSGKTSALRFLLKAVVDGLGREISGFVITEGENHSLFVYHSDDVRVEIDALEIPVQHRTGWPKIDTFLYGGHVNVLTGSDDIMTMEWGGMINATEGYLLTADLMHYGRELSTNGYFSFRDHATAFNYQNQWRVCNFLSQYEGPMKSLLHLPEYVLVLPNTAGQWSMKHRIKEEERVDYPNLAHAKEWTFKEFRLAELIYYSMINYISDGLGERNLWEGYMTTWGNTLAEQYKGDIVTLFRQFIDNQRLTTTNNYRVLLEYIHQVIENVSVHCQFDERSLFHYFYFHVDDDSMKTFLGWLQSNPTFIASRYFDLHYAHDIDDYTILSSGEKAMLDMYSRIYDAVISKHQRDSNYIWPTLFVFDEAEIGFHPEWQRSYVKNITLFLEEMAKMATDLKRRYRQDAPEFRYQVILSSHSPIILSDIPSQCAIMLRRKPKENRTVNESATRQQTFGTNIFELYRDSFFLEDGLMGEFAENVIKKILSDIEENNDVDTLPNRIQLVGDPQIRNYLTMKYASINKDGAVSLLEDQIKQIKERR